MLSTTRATDWRTITSPTTMQSAERDEVGAPPACGGESDKRN
jgi:hypothetical protein